MKRIGVYVCHCGTNIAGTVDVKKVVEQISKEEDVVVAKDYTYMCSEPGQNLIKQDIKDYSLDRIVVTSCSPTLHELTFQNAVSDAGLNRYCFEMANIREQCSWVHKDKKEATEKALLLIKSAVAKVRLLNPLQDFEVGVTNKALVIGGGIAGIQASLDIANAGYEVHLVEKDSSIGGHMAQLDKTFPTLDCSACILTPKMVDIARHPNIQLHTYSEVEQVDGFVGNFTVKIKKKARYVDEEKCTGCDLCSQNCLVRYVPQKRKTISVKSKIEEKMLAFLDDVLAKSNYQKQALIQILQDINQEYMYLPEIALRYVSEVIDVPLSRIYHLATFYSCFSLEPRGKHLIRVCMGTACHTRGAPKVLEEFERHLKITAGQTTKDMNFTLETVNCLGCCALGPVVVIDDNYYSMHIEDVGKVLLSIR